MNWSQFRAILWLRWRLSRNQFVRGGTLNAALSILVAVLLAGGAIGAAIGGLAGGWAAGAKANPHLLMVILDGVLFGFLMFWGIGLLVEFQRSESLDLPKLLHLPITLQHVFAFNYVVSHLSPGMVLFLPAIGAFCVGLIFGGGLLLALMIPVTAAFIFLITAWSYCLRGWLAALMTNKRRRRSIIVWITLIFALMGQLPNLIIQSTVARNGNHQSQSGRPGIPARTEFELPDWGVSAHLAPPGWLGYSALSLKQGNPWPTLGFAVAAAIIGALGLQRAYGMTMRFYRGSEAAQATPIRQPTPIQPLPAAGRLFLERKIPWIPEEAGALALATFRSLVRSPELKMSLIMPVVMGIVMLSLSHSLKRSPTLDRWTVAMASGAVAIAALATAPMMGNMFGLDRSGFRALVLLPTRRDYVLLAKNLAFFPFMAAFSLVMIMLALFAGGFSVNALLIGLLQTPTIFMTVCLFCNLTSILTPYRMAAGSLQAKKPKAIVFVAALAAMLVTPLASPILIIPPALHLMGRYIDWPAWVPVGPLAAAVILALVGGAYRLLLPMEGRLLQRREPAILLEVTEETE